MRGLVDPNLVAGLRSLVATLLLFAAATGFAASGDEEAFLNRHWAYPIAPQGAAPDRFSPPEASLDPAQCGLCHIEQSRDWQTSLHRRSMGPGVAGQLLDLVEDDPETADVCWRCHVPLAEQQPLRRGSSGWQPNPSYQPALHEAGLSCAGCHVRGHQRFGPPRRSEPTRTGPIRDGLPHDGFTAESAFETSAFCRGCHQFEPGGYALNGKLIENTYAEWQASDYARRGVTCQSCHMPDRRHLWRGIHDPEMTRSGITVETAITRPARHAGDGVEATITIVNSGTGHHFPTYLTPKVFVRGWLVDHDGNSFDATFQEATIGREVTLDLSQELYDTRIPAGGSVTVRYAERLPVDGARLRIELVVAPDHFYTRFYEATLAGGGGGRGRQLLQQALADSQASPYTLWSRTLAAGDP